MKPQPSNVIPFPPRPRWLRLDQGGADRPGVYVGISDAVHFSRWRLWCLRIVLGWRIVERLP